MSRAAGRAELCATAGGGNIDWPERVHAGPVDHIPYRLSIYYLVNKVAELPDPDVERVCKELYGVVGLCRLLGGHASSHSISGLVPIYPHLLTILIEWGLRPVFLMINALNRFSVRGPFGRSMDPHLEGVSG